LIEIGKNQILEVEQSDRSGYYLICPDNYEVFLPGSLAPNDLKTGDQLGLRDLNDRPMKCLDWKTPYEVLFNRSVALTT
jgi:hypothetical protein